MIWSVETDSFSDSVRPARKSSDQTNHRALTKIRDRRNERAPDADTVGKQMESRIQTAAEQNCAAALNEAKTLTGWSAAHTTKLPGRNEPARESRSNNN
jgi:hypothetical protein